MKKEYRSAVRSRRMIRQAFMELLQEKEFSKITVTDIVNRADLNRSTFYAHYPDVRGVIEEIQEELLEHSMAMLNGDNMKNILVDPLPYLQKISAGLEENIDFYCRIGNTLDARLFLDRFRRLIAEDLRRREDIPEAIRNAPDLIVNIHFFTGGIMNSYQQWMEGNIGLPLDEMNLYLAENIKRFAAAFSDQP